MAMNYGQVASFDAGQAVALRSERNPHFLFLTIALFLLIAPLSFAPLPYVVTMKYLRLGVMLFGGFVAMRWYPRGGKLGKAFMVLGVTYLSSSLWSEDMTNALLYKSMFLAMVFGGICLGSAIRTFQQFIALSRIMVVTGFLFVLLTLVLVNEGLAPQMQWRHGRFTIIGLNANYVGMLAAIYSIFSAVLIFFGRSQSNRILGTAGLLLFGWATLNSGSRLAILMALAGGGLIVFVRAERYRQAMILIGLFVCFSAYLSYSSSPAPESFSGDDYSAEGQASTGYRAIDDWDRDTRTSVWRPAFRRWQMRPLLGEGWAQTGDGRWQLVHSVYIQFLLEAGLLGAAAWVYALTMTLVKVKRLSRLRGLLEPQEWRIAQLGISLVLCCLLHGAGESGLVSATMPLAIGLGLGVQYIDAGLGKIDRRMAEEGDAYSDPEMACQIA